MANTYCTPTILYRMGYGIALEALMVHYHCWLWDARLRQVLCHWQGGRSMPGDTHEIAENMFCYLAKHGEGGSKEDQPMKIWEAASHS